MNIEGAEATPATEFRIRDLATLRTLAHPLRLDILERLTSPSTVSELATAMQVPRTRLYRHVHALLDAGTIEVVETRRARRFVEAVYQATASRFVPSPDLLAGASLTDLVEAVLGTVFDTTRADLSRRMQSGQLSFDQTGAGPRTMSLARQLTHLSPAAADSVVEAIEALVATMPDEPDQTLFCFQYAFYQAGETLG